MKITFELDTTNTDEFNEETKKALAVLLGFEMEDEAPPVKKKKAVVEEEDEEEPAPVKKKKTTVVDIPEEDDEDDDADTSEGYTQERVKEKCQELIEAGKAAKLKAVLAEFGYTKVVQLKPKDFDKFMAKANKIK